MKNYHPFLLLLYLLIFIPKLYGKNLTSEEALHFQRRLGYEIDKDFQQKLLKMNKDQAIDYVLSRTKTVASNPPREWLNQFEEIYLTIIKHRRGLIRKEERKNIPQLAKRILEQFPNIPKNLKNQFLKSLKDPQKIRRSLNMLSNKVLALDLQAWWLEEMINTQSPLTERMTLFWHNHFATSYRKVKVLPWMYKQNTILRKNALGNFKDLLKSISTDAAMLWYLDSNKNVVGTPNENFAREVMELFTLGEGNYSEKDIKEAARAFTGWDFDKFTGKFVFKIKRHDRGVKTILGKNGNFNGHDVLDILLKDKRTAEFITRKIWKEFISPKPDELLVKQWGDRFYQSGYEIKVLLREMFSSKVFYEARGSLIKSPVDFLVGTIRQFRVEPSVTIPYALASKKLGQELFNPPNVKGWSGGKKWINTATLLLRKDFISRMFRVGEKKEKKMGNMMNNPMKMMAQVSVLDMENWMGTLGREDVRSFLHPLPSVNKIKRRKNILAWTRQLVLDPVYQLR